MYWFVNSRGRKVRRSTEEAILAEAKALAKAPLNTNGLGSRADDRIHVYKGDSLAFTVHGRSGYVSGRGPASPTSDGLADQPELGRPSWPDRLLLPWEEGQELEASAEAEPPRGG